MQRENKRQESPGKGRARQRVCVYMATSLTIPTLSLSLSLSLSAPHPLYPHRMVPSITQRRSFDTRTEWIFCTSSWSGQDFPTCPVP
jgi:hypothetical protein